MTEGLDKVRPWQRPPADEKVLHACPECPIGAPRPDCWCCGGYGAITDGQLARWQRIVNQTAAL